MKNRIITVSEALQMIKSGETLTGYSVDFKNAKVEALDVMKFTKAGIDVPENVIYYGAGENIAYDEAFAGDWKKIV